MKEIAPKQKEPQCTVNCSRNYLQPVALNATGILLSVYGIVDNSFVLFYHHHQIQHSYGVINERLSSCPFTPSLTPAPGHGCSTLPFHSFVTQNPPDVHRILVQRGFDIRFIVYSHQVQTKTPECCKTLRVLSYS